jgi:hypothetical protein
MLQCEFWANSGAEHFIGIQETFRGEMIEKELVHTGC